MLEQILPQHIAAEDFELLIRADMHNPDHCHIPTDELISKLWTGIFELWRFEDRSGIVLIEKVGSRLNMVRIAGKAIIFRFDEIVEAMQHRARELNCTSIETMVYSDKLIKALERIGAKQEAVNMVLEFNHG